MRSTIAIPVIIAVASVTPAFAAPVAPTSAPGSEAINIKKVGSVVGDVASVAEKILPFFFRRELENELLARGLGVDYTTIPRPVEMPSWLKQEFTARAVPSGTDTEPGSEAINIKKVGSVVGDVASVASKILPFFFRRELEGELLARGFGDDYTTFPRLMNMHAALNARFAPSETAIPGAPGSEAINIKKVGSVVGDVASVASKILPFFFRRELENKREFANELLARAFEDELMARDSSTHMRRSLYEGPGPVRLSPTFQELCGTSKRSISDEIMARAPFYEGPGPQAVRLPPAFQELCGTSKRSILDELD